MFKFRFKSQEKWGVDVYAPTPELIDLVQFAVDHGIDIALIE